MTAPAFVCDYDEARSLTDEIKNAAERVWALLERAHRQRAWEALGYESWREYAQTEFGMSQSHAYRILDQAKVIAAIESAVSPKGEKPRLAVNLTERQARDVKPVLPQVLDGVRQRTADPDLTPEQVQAVVIEEVEKTRAFHAPRAERNARADAAMERVLAAVPDDFDPDEDQRRILAAEAVVDAVEEIAAITYSPEFLAGWLHPSQLGALTPIRTAITFLTSYADTVEARA